jgi:hypothetical protein
MPDEPDAAVEIVTNVPDSMQELPKHLVGHMLLDVPLWQPTISAIQIT